MAQQPRAQYPSTERTVHERKIDHDESELLHLLGAKVFPQKYVFFNVWGEGLQEYVAEH